MQSDIGDEWQVVHKDPGRYRNTPQLSIYGDGTGHINAAGDDTLGNPEWVRLHTDPENGRLAIEAADENKEDVYSFSRDKREGRTGRGGDIRTRRALDTLGVDADALRDLDETQHLQLEEVSDEVLAADLSGLPGVADTPSDDRNAPEDDTTEDDGEPVCGFCGKARSAHDGAGRCPGADEFGEPPTSPEDDADGNDDEDVAFDETVKVEEPEDDGSTSLEFRVVGALQEHGELSGPDLKTVAECNDGLYKILGTLEDKGIVDKRADPEDGRRTLYTVCGSDGEDTPSKKVVRDAGAAVETVQALGDLLDVSTDEARGLALDADVYRDLEDAVERPGVKREAQ